MDEKFLKKLLATMKCGMCGNQYQSGNVNILGHKEDLWFLSVFCPSCKTQGLVAAVVKEGKVTEVLTELTPEEQKNHSDYDNALDVTDEGTAKVWRTVLSAFE